MGVYIKHVQAKKIEKILEMLGIRINEGDIIEIKEPHGRLIDGDKLKKRLQKVATEAWKMKLNARVETVWNQAIDYIDYALTVIESEEREHE